MSVGGTCFYNVSSLPVINFKENISNGDIFGIVKNKNKQLFLNLIDTSLVRNNISCTNKDNETPLMIACKHKRWANAFTILERYGEESLPGFINNKGISVIYYACSNDNLIGRFVSYKSVQEIMELSFHDGSNLLINLAKNGNFITCNEIIPKLSKKFINYIDESGNTALLYAISNRNYNICNLLIQYGADTRIYNKEGKNALMMLQENANIICNNELLNVYFSIFETKREENIINDFQLFEPGYFTSLINIHNSEGSYGSMKYAYDRSNGRSYVLKHYKKASSFKLLSEDFIKEVTYIRELSNKIDSIIKIHGLYCDDVGNYYIIFEPLAVTIYNYVAMLSLYDSSSEFSKNKERRFSNIFTSVLNIIKKIHNNGFIHNDLKFENIMFDYNGNIKILDFGISDFIGISPYKNVISNYITSSHIKAPDNGCKIKINILEEIKNEPGKYKNVPLSFQTCRKSYASDLYSLGMSMIQIVLNRNEKFYSIDTTLYKEIHNDILSKDHLNLMKVSNQTVDKLRQFSFGNEIIKLLNIDARKRTDVSVRLINPTEYKNLSEEPSLFHRIVHYSPSDIKNQNNELIIADNLFLNNKHHSIQITNYNNRQEVIDIFNRILSLINNKISIDCYYNSLLNSINYNGSENLTVVCISYFYIFNNIFEWFPIDIKFFCEQLNLDSYVLIDCINNFIYDTLPNIKIISFISIVERMILILQSNSCESHEIASFESNVFNSLLNFIQFSKLGYKINLWNFVQENASNFITSFTYTPIYDI